MSILKVLPFTASALVVAGGILGGCANVSGVHTRPGPRAEIPHFTAGDPRVETAGFVRETLRVSIDRADRTHTLMAFAVGETLTLGAMVTGGFRGLVRWKIGGRRISFAMNTAGSLENIPVEIEGEPTTPAPTGQGASFRGTTWVNIELPLADWVSDGTPLQLVFLPEIGEHPLFLPDDGFHYEVEFVRS